ncbi:MAG: alpha-glucan family phosphorylase [Planctomycetota bacterium]
MPTFDHDIAYFSLEIGFDAHIPTYSGGLGILAGDTLRAAADLELPYVGVTLLYRGGYFKQRLGTEGEQVEEATAWAPEEVLRPMTPRVVVPVDGRDVVVRAWRLDVFGVGGYLVPVYYLDTDLPENDPAARELTARLYAGDTDHRIRQEAILGIGGRRMLRAIGHDLGTFHMNEGHACFVCVELLSEHLSRAAERRDGQGGHHLGVHDTPAPHSLTDDSIASVRSRCVFTTHTPVAAGHDRFQIERVKAIIGHHPVFDRPDLYGEGSTLNTTKLAMNFSSFSNAVARKHGEVSRAMFPGYPIHAITNGVHAASWVSDPVRALFDGHVPEWKRVNTDLRMCSALPTDSLVDAHKRAKNDLLELVEAQSGVRLDREALTMVFSRRMTDYKRPSLLLRDVERLRNISKNVGKVQVIYAGKSHPNDGRGKEIIREIHEKARDLGQDCPVVFLSDYDIEVSKKLVSGADVWLNNPRPPLEASGTSGMKAALNGVPSLSTLDGWWLEGWVEGRTGWAIGETNDDATFADNIPGMDEAHADSLYSKLEHAILPAWQAGDEAWAEIMRACIALNGSYFTTERMVSEYALRAYVR